MLNRLRAEKIKMRIFAEMLVQMSKKLPYFVQIGLKANKFHLTVIECLEMQVILLFEMQVSCGFCFISEAHPQAI